MVALMKQLPGVSVNGLTLHVVETPEQVASFAATRLAAVVERRADAALGLATGNTPIPIYRKLVRRHAAGLSFEGVTTFNLDEYHPIARDAPGSFRRYMRDHLFDHVDLAGERTHLPDGTTPPEQIEAHCRDYERAIAAAGGIDLQLLGIGGNGHVAFNEPGSARTSRTRRVALHDRTRADNAAAFPDGEVPTHAITMGIGTILEARDLLLVACGAGKADAVSAAVHGPIDEACPASLLREHGRVELVLDTAAAARLDLASNAARG